MRKILILVLGVVLLGACNQDEANEDFFFNYVETKGITEIPNWLKKEWVHDPKDRIECNGSPTFAYINEKRIKSDYAFGDKENANVWIRKTSTKFEIISKFSPKKIYSDVYARLDIKEPNMYYLEEYKKTREGMSYKVSIIDDKGKCVYGGCNCWFKYNIKQ